MTGDGKGADNFADCFPHVLRTDPKQVDPIPDSQFLHCIILFHVNVDYQTDWSAPSPGRMGLDAAANDPTLDALGINEC